jgi:hypothetical protein
MTQTRFLLAAVAIAASIAGCNTSSVEVGDKKIPLPTTIAGTWTGEAKLNTGSDLVKIENKLSGDKMTGDSKLTLNGDGTGFMKVAKGAEQPVTWKQEGPKVIVEKRSIEEKTKSPDSEGPYVATLSEDKKTMTFDMGNVKVVLSKSS